MAIRKMGYGKHQLSSHGLRSTFSTILNDSGLFQDNWIEAQLSHIDKNRTRASYNHADYLAQRTEMMQWWGDYLSTVSENRTFIHRLKTLWGFKWIVNNILTVTWSAEYNEYNEYKGCSNHKH
jgi:poly-beta-hydroxyalkanoate depolymerase